MRGRPRKPLEEHARNGNPSKLTDLEGRLAAQPHPQRGIPARPDWLDEAAVAEWDRITPILNEQGLMTHADLAAIAAYCCCFSRIGYAESRIKADKAVMLRDGVSFVSPWIKIANEAYGLLRAFLSEFGMSPSSRSKAMKAPMGKEKSKLSAFTEPDDDVEEVAEG